MSLLLDYCRNEVGLKMGGLHHGNHIGWTTSREKAERAREAGALLRPYYSRDPEFSGWEIVFAVGREMNELTPPAPDDPASTYVEKSSSGIPF